MNENDFIQNIFTLAAVGKFQHFIDYLFCAVKSGRGEIYLDFTLVRTEVWNGFLDDSAQVFIGESLVQFNNFCVIEFRRLALVALASFSFPWSALV